MSTEAPFTIAIPDNDLEFLRKKLELTRLPDELEEAGHEYGAPLADVQRLAKYWQDEYLPKWREHEARLNDLPQFTRDIEVEGFGTLNIHYVHKKSEVADAIPLLFVHGWPGSFIEVRKILPLLIQASSDHPSFHVVALSLPGYGFSDNPKKKGFAVGQYAEVCNKLMLALGYNEYITQGGDWGSLITRKMAQVYGARIAKGGTPTCPFAPPTQRRSTQPQAALSILSHFILGYTEKEKAGLKRSMLFQEHGIGYFKEQATQPQTLGYSLADSPGRGSDLDIHLLVSKAGPTASTRIYFEITKQNPLAFSTDLATPIPTGYSYFPKEIAVSLTSDENPELGLRIRDDKGGHFAAWEVPDALVGDLRKMFGKGSRAFGVVPGKTGYQQN
ncbi:epoxide hydrolase 1 [Coprinellus micaceus]|uniref:Epoxide hydrolase 1 n=1 Tax=Coprinellus micaceus TaxID=71717 RepID=A0A4Y7RLW9_COPMI|nr:epoxide hydrolase 1 [Coprinellus micaceus]